MADSPLETGNRTPMNRATSGRTTERAPVTESEDAIRNLKASESVMAAFLAERVPTPPAEVAALITNQVKSAIKALPLSQVANMTPGSGVLATAASAGVEQYLGMLTPAQREAAKVGVNPLDPVAMLKSNAALNQIGGAGGFSRSAEGSSARYDGIGSSGDWSSPAGQAQMRELAIKSGIGWAANNPDLLRLGPAAIQTLAQSHLKEENYKVLKNRLEFSDRDVVAGARYSNRHHLDYNEITTSTDKAVDGLPSEEKKDLVGGVKKLFHCKPEEEAQCKTELNSKVERLKTKHPDKAQQFEQLQQSLGTRKEAELKERLKTGAKDVRADAKDENADKKVEKVEVITASTQNDMDDFSGVPRTAQASEPKKDEKSPVRNAEAKSEKKPDDKSKPAQPTSAKKQSAPTMNG
ncbi:hypothetical protein [uncultured Bradyrhizobium sp.]|jgi:hypothetical protein|uniref:hypothetical protein n=1 Tax=uncultured Bradyrhizobium sp. TaxID=199684 RepID=UPI002606D9FA|nr:hypothetical protein [uncultured Bradyrhizobium sp.]